jgi:hypothetical protein
MQHFALRGAVTLQISSIGLTKMLCLPLDVPTRARLPGLRSLRRRGGPVGQMLYDTCSAQVKLRSFMLYYAPLHIQDCG